MTTIQIPTPAALAHRQVAVIEPDAKAKIEGPVRPGLVETTVSLTHDGVVKTKHLEEGMVVRPFVHGQPRGAERTIQSLTRIDDGAFWDVDTGDMKQSYKAAYRWYCEALDGKPIQKTVKTPGFVPYHQEA